MSYCGQSNDLQHYQTTLLPERQSSHHRHRHHASTSVVPTSSRHRSRLDPENSSTVQFAAQPILREEDECPVCHLPLPPKGPDGSESAREAHVTSCIESHFSSSSPQPPGPHSSVATASAVAANAILPLQPGERRAAVQVSGIQGSPNASTSFFMPRRRTTGMIVYHASEKDCVGEDGEGTQECLICFEEFAVGDEMGRLECLCKFHKVNHPISLEHGPKRC